MNRMNVIGIGLAALMFLIPPWRKNEPTDRSFVGYGPLFSPPLYEILVRDPPLVEPPQRYREDGGLERDPATGRTTYVPGEWKETEPRFIPQSHFEQRAGRLAWGRLTTQWLALGTVTWMVSAFRRRSGS